MFRARRYFDCLGAMAMNKGAAYVHSDSWREADSRYIKLVDWQAPPEYQFSEDGTNWHDQQQDADLYYHERRPGGQWGGAVKMKIGQTGAAAGFGAPTIAVETLPAGSDATASVAASGDNTAKVFNFNFGIPKGADGKNGTDGKAGADGADGVSSYTYVAYASDASGGGFSLTPSNALKFRAEIHTTTAIETPDAADFAGATWVKYIGDDGTGAGDMTKSVYDTNDDGIVDHAATADAVGATTAAQVADAVGKAHTHANKATLDKLAEADGKLTFDGSEIGGGSGTVKSVNGQLPDESGNVTVETGGAVDESRLLPELATIPEELSGHPVVYDYQSGIDADTLCLLHLDDSTWADATGKNTITQHGNVAKVSDSGYFSKALDLSGNQSSGSLSWLTVPWLAEYEAATWTMEFFAKPTKSVVNFMFFSFGNSQGSYLSLGSQSLTNLWLGNGSGTYTGNFSFSLNTWYWFVIQYDGSAVKVYVDGQLVVQGNFTPNYVGQDLQFGNLNLVNNQDNTFIGYLDEFRWSKGLRYPTGGMTAPTEPYGTPAKSYKVSKADLVFSDSTRLLPENPVNGDIPCFDATATVGGGNDANTRILLHFDADEIKDEAAGNAAPVTITKKTGTITVVEGGKWGKCAKYVTGSMTVATNLDELNANNWVVSGWFNPDENNHGVSYPTWLSMDDQNTHGFGFDSTGRYGESDGPLFYLDTPPASGTWHWLAIVKYSGGLRFYLNGAFLNEISAQQRANFCSTLAIGGFAGTHAAGSTERTFSGLVDEVRLQYIPDDEITLWTGTSIAVPDAPYSKPQTVGEWSKFNKSELVKSVNGQTPDSSGAVTLPEATTSAAGLMAAADKVKLDSFNITEYKDRPGYFKLPGGIIVQWGAILDVSESKTFDVTLPVAFPHLGWVSLASGTSTTVATAAYFNGANALKVVTNVTGAGSFAVYWLAIGY